MGTSEKNIFQSQMDKFFPDVENTDLIFIAAQECAQGKISSRVGEIEMHLRGKGFLPIDETSVFGCMYQMFLTCFAKKELMKDVSRVRFTRLAKGQSMLVTTLGNKGGL